MMPCLATELTVILGGHDDLLPSIYICWETFPLIRQNCVFEYFHSQDLYLTVQSVTLWHCHNYSNSCCKKPLFSANTQFYDTNPSTKAVPVFVAPFQPQSFPVVTAHRFLAAYGNSIAPAFPPQTNFNLMSKADVQAACDIHLIQWIVSCLRNIGENRPIQVFRNTGCLPRILGQHQSEFPDIRVDFALIYGQILEEEHVAAVLQTKAVGSLRPTFWQGTIAGNTSDRKIAQEARA